MRGERLRAVGDDAARRAEVEQHRPTVGEQQDVVGRDVAVVHAFAVQQLEHAEQGLDERVEPGLVRGRGHVQARVLQRLAAVVLHRHVGGRVAAPETVHLDQRPGVEAGEQPGFAEERFEPLGEGLGEAPAAQRDRRPCAAPGERRGHVLLDRDVAMQHWSLAR